MTIVLNPVRTLRSRNSDSRDEPSTTSGVVSGSTSSRLTAELPRNLYRVRARAMSVPKIVATSVDNAATRRLSFIDS